MPDHGDTTILGQAGGQSAPLRLASWQGPSPAGSDAAAFAALSAALRAAGAMGATMLVAPELFLPGYNHDRIPATAQPRGGGWHRQLAEIVRGAGCGLTIGYAERAGDRLYNSAVAFDASGTEVAHYRKIQLYGPREKTLFTPGESYTTFDLGGIPAALLICYDIEFAPHVAALASRGVRLILVPTANMLPFTHVSRATVPAMAANHGVSIVYSNFCGTEKDLVYAGTSLIVGPEGEILASAGQGPALLVADLPAAIDPARLSTQITDYTSIE